METLSSDKVFFIVFLRNQTGSFFGCIRKNRNRDLGMKPEGFFRPLKEIEFTDEKEERYNS